MTPPLAPRALVLERIREIGQAEVARRVAPLWGWSPQSAASRLSRWMKEPGSPGFKDMSSEAVFALICALGMTINREEEAGDPHANRGAPGHLGVSALHRVCLANPVSR